MSLRKLNYKMAILILTILSQFGLFQQAVGQIDLSPPVNVKLDSLSGKTVVIALNLSNPNAAPIDAFGLTLLYPKNLLSFQKTDTAGTLTDDWISVLGQENTSGEVIIGGFNTTPTTNSGVLLNVIFEVSDIPGTDSLKLGNFKDDLVEATTTNGTLDLTIVSVSHASNAPQDFTLSQNYPNPFNPETTIRYDLPIPSQVVLRIYNILGEEIRTLVDEGQSAGVKTVVWDGKNNRGDTVGSGMYYYRIEANDFSKTLKLILMR